MGSAKQADLREVRDELVEAVGRMSDVSSDGDSGLVDQIFDQVGAVIRQRFGLSRTEADLMLADARMEGGSGLLRRRRHGVVRPQRCCLRDQRSLNQTCIEEKARRSEEEEAAREAVIISGGVLEALRQSLLSNRRIGLDSRTVHHHLTTAMGRDKMDISEKPAASQVMSRGEREDLQRLGPSGFRSRRSDRRTVISRAGSPCGVRR
jgi:hypothetical protein